MNRITICAAALAAIATLAACDDGYDFDKYTAYRQDGELSDVVHEWMHAYIEDYCRVEGDQIACE